MRAWIERLEAYFGAQSGTKRWMALLGVVMLVGVLGYLFLFEPMLGEFEAKKAQLALLDENRAKEKVQKIASQIDSIERKIASVQKEIERTKTEQQELAKQIEAQSYQLYSQENFAKILDKILSDSKSKKIYLRQIEIEDRNDPFLGRLYEKKRISVHGEGAFLNIVRFLRGIEERKILSRTTQLSIETNGSVPQFSFVISFYGAKL
ncbi:MAG: hypothetical protein C6H99_01985 [Epsilonproteobacteria bacterium]|nr:hypothetical protein [Campylobacterota bacterium]NPA63852.1 hypothetical protein [Campylobacterota bacterium]